MKKIIIGSAALMGLGLVLGVFLATNISTLDVSSVFAKEKIGADSAPVTLTTQAEILNNAFVAASDAIVPAVVSISVEVENKKGRSRYNDQFQEFFKFFGDPRFEQKEPDERSFRSRGSGSGVVISADGYIVTNNHVIENAVADGIKITTSDKKQYTAKLIGADPLTDLAVLKIEETGLKAAHFAEMSDVRVGDWVLAVGNPLGLNSTVTSGIVSAIGRGRLGLNSSSYSVENYIQTDAAINPGNSGGGLFNLKGSLVGINTAIATGTGNYIGYGFAIPIDLAKSVILDLIDDGKINRGYIGVRISNVRDEIEAKALGLEKVSGVKVEGVEPNSAALAAGLEQGDVILELDGRETTTSNELQSLVAQRRAGDAVELTIWRDGKRITKKVTLKSKDDDENITAITGPDEKESESKTEPIEFEKLGFSIQPLDATVKKELDIKQGAFISSVKPYSMAAERGLMPNGVILKADRREVKTTGDLEKIIKSKKPGDALLLQVQYKESTRIIAIEIPKVSG